MPATNLERRTIAEPEVDTEQQAGSDTPPETFEQPREYDDMVDEASALSFPASDPPAHAPVD